MQVARAAGAGTDRQLTGQLRLAGRGECRHFLMAHMHPFDRAPAAQYLREAVQAVAHDAEDTLGASLLQRCHNEIGYIFDRHEGLPILRAISPSAAPYDSELGAPGRLQFWIRPSSAVPRHSVMASFPSTPTFQSAVGFRQAEVPRPEGTCRPQAEASDWLPALNGICGGNASMRVMIIFGAMMP